MCFRREIPLAGEARGVERTSGFFSNPLSLELAELHGARAVCLCCKSQICVIVENSLPPGLVLQICQLRVTG